MSPRRDHHVPLAASGARVCRVAPHPLCFSLPVTLEQFSLAVRRCPDQEDQALLTKVGYHSPDLQAGGICSAPRRAHLYQRE